MSANFKGIVLGEAKIKVEIVLRDTLIVKRYAIARRKVRIAAIDGGQELSSPIDAAHVIPKFTVLDAFAYVVTPALGLYDRIGTRGRGVRVSLDREIVGHN